MKLVTFNLHLGGRRGGGSHWDLLEEHFSPDIVFAQETTRVKQLVEGHRECVWRRVIGRDWGSAVVVKGRVLEEIPLPEYAGWVAGCYAELDRGGQVAAFSLHAPLDPGKKHPAVVKDIITAIAKLKADVPIVIGGDLNLVSAGARGSEELVATTPIETNLMKQIHDDLGLVSCWGVAHDGETLPQTLRWSRDPEIPYHCDVVLVPDTWTVDVCEIPQGEPWTRMSDHSPVVASVTESIRAATATPPRKRAVAGGRRSDVA